jgi:AbiV family abortive infection protein
MSEKKSDGKYQQALRECVRNGCSLLEDAEYLRDWEKHGTAYAIAILAEEEFSKAFLLYLIQDNVIPWTPEIRRAIRNHECKHLLSILMDHLAEKGEYWWSQTIDQRINAPDEPLPGRLVAAINLFRHDKIGRFHSPSWDVLEPGDYDSATKKISEGSVDRAKQSAIYVNIASDGTTLTTPRAVSAAQSAAEIERAKRIKELATDMEHGFVSAFREYAALKKLLAAVFDPTQIAVALMQGHEDAQQER